MLTISIPATELFDASTSEFIQVKAQTLQLEHSLVSLSKWESKWHKPFLTKKPLSLEETLDYFRCMTVTKNIKPEVFRCFNRQLIDEVSEYIKDPMTATTIRKLQTKPSREIITAEIIYYWMIALQIPIEFEKWHLNRLMTLIDVVSIKNTPQKKMSKSELFAQQRALNASRQKQFGTTG